MRILRRRCAVAVGGVRSWTVDDRGPGFAKQPDIRRALELLGWEPEVGMEEGLKRTIEWFRERLAADRTEVSPPPFDR